LLGFGNSVVRPKSNLNGKTFAHPVGHLGNIWRTQCVLGPL